MHGVVLFSFRCQKIYGGNVMSEKKYPNRWAIAIAGVVMQTCLGTVYAWSIFRNPLVELGYGWTGTHINLAFTLVIIALAFSAVVGGYILDARGPRIIGTLSGIFFGMGILITGVATQIGNLWVLYLGYCLICGIGLGFGYIVPVATLVKWFPDKRGLISGLAVMGFGLGSGLMSALAPGMIDSIGAAMTLYIFGIIFFIAVIVSAQFMIPPPAGYIPAGWIPPAGRPEGATLREALRSKKFYFLWGMLFINAAAGMAVISRASPMAQTFMNGNAATNAQLAGALMLVFSLFNGIGRLFWAALSDKISRRKVYFIMFVSQAVAFYVISASGSLIVFVILACYIYSCLGGGFATMPAYAADTFGTKYVGRIYGWIFTAKAAAGIAGPTLYARIFQAGGSYSPALLITSIMFAAAICIPALAAQRKGE